jgi:osmotically-inducible protein OsmY
LWTALLVLALVAMPLAARGAPADIEDQDITQTVEREFATDDGVAGHLIDVTTTEGVVTLSGSVDNVLAKDRAVEIAQAVKGVRSVIDKISVDPVARPDADIRSDILSALAADPATESWEITVQVENGRATLSGEVDSWQEKQLAATVAKGVRGVTGIENNITADYETDRPDSEIAAEVKRQLEIDERVDAALIEVNVDDGKVTLTGTIGSAAERSRARSDAWVAGTTAVDASALDVEWWARDRMVRKKTPSLTDSEIEQAVEDAFLYDPRVLSFKPEVEVGAGVVTLSGKVGNLAARRAAEEDARNTVGVWRVDNYLRVRPEQRPTDTELADRVRNAIERDPYLERYDITVTVVNGKAYLYGAVDSQFEKTQAEMVASNVAGVIEVSNELDVTERWTWRDDWEIRQDIESELWWSPFVDSDQVTVAVDDGVATLTGTVDSWQERSAAAENAREGGAKRVRNRLRVSDGEGTVPPYGPPYGS